ncbi:hypothetical protein AAZX31_18G256600 [Glycine max]
MASIFKLLFLILFLGLVFQGVAANCPIEGRFSISQSQTPDWAHGMPQWKVKVTNKCACAQSQVKLNCSGFQTNFVENPSILNISGNVCLLKNGLPIGIGETVEFLYAWLPKFPFQPISSIGDCN